MCLILLQCLVGALHSYVLFDVNISHCVQFAQGFQDFGWSQGSIDRKAPIRMETSEDYSTVSSDINIEFEFSRYVHSMPNESYEQNDLQFGSAAGVSSSLSRPLVTLSNQLNPFDNNGTGIRIRNRQVQNPPRIMLGAHAMMSQGEAPRRIRLQRKLQVGPVTCSAMALERRNWSPERESKPVATEVTSLLTGLSKIL